MFILIKKHFEKQKRLYITIVGEKCPFLYASVTNFLAREFVTLASVTNSFARELVTLASVTNSLTRRC